MREIRTSGSTRGQWVADTPSLTVLLYRANFFPFVRITHPPHLNPHIQPLPLQLPRLPPNPA